MHHGLRNCFFMVLGTFLVFSLGSIKQAESATPEKAAETSKSTAAAPDKVAAVNGTAISQAQLDNAMGYQQEMAALKGVTIADDQLPQLKYELLQNLIGKELLYQESQKSGITVEEKEITDSYESQKQKGQFKTDAEFEAALKQSQKTLAAYKAEIKQGLAIDHFIKNSFSDKTTVPDSEAKAYYDQNPSYFKEPARVRASHIMIKVDSKADQAKKDEAKKKIEAALKRVKAGEDFAAVAREVTEDTNSKENGGDLNYFSKNQLPASFENAAFALQKGGISDIVTTDSGYHIIKLTDKTDARTISFEEAKKDIAESLKSSKVNSAVSQYIIVLKNRSTIVTFPISK